MTTDFRALCAELVDDLELCDWPYKLSETIRADINRARAALAEPQPEEPTDEELYDYWISTSPEFGCADPIGFARAVLARWGNLSESPNSSDEPAVPEDREPAKTVLRQVFDDHSDYIDDEQVMWWGDFHAAARAVLARLGTPSLAETRSSLVDAPQPLAEGRELAPVTKQPTVMQLIELSEEIEADGLGQVDFARAVLARWGRPVPAPVPVSERLPEPEDCSSDGKCWWFCFECPGEHSYWIFAKEVYCAPTYWLPAHALPLPDTND